MTISTTTTRVTYATDGSSTAFAIPFPFFGAAEINAALVNSTGTTLQFLILNSDYTVTGGNDAPGTLTFTTAPATGQTVLIYRLTNRTQTTDLEANQDMPAAALELAFDRLAALAAEDLELFGRTLHAPVNEGAMVALPPAITRANMLAGYDSGGQPTTYPVPAVNLGTPVQPLAALRYALTADLAPTQLYGVDADGLYRVSYYMNIPSGTVTAGDIALFLAWSDGTVYHNPPGTALDAVSAHLSSMQGTMVMWCVAGSSIQFDTQSAGIVGSLQYNLYLTAERLM